MSAPSLAVLPALGPSAEIAEILAFLACLTALAEENPADRLVLRMAGIEQLGKLDGLDHEEAIVDRAIGLRAKAAGVRHPSLGSEAFHGPAGSFVVSLAPHSEADPAALLVAYVVVAGALFGSRAHVRIEADRHPARLFVLIVGRTAKARKGTALGRVEQVARMATPDFDDLMRTGLSSGEGVTFAVRDPVLHNGEIVDPGVLDKRLIVVEGEFAQALKVMSRDGNTLSPTLRAAWDSGRLQTLTKNSPMRASGAHVVVIGAITVDELGRHLQSVELPNGLANRFLFVAAERSKALPFGGALCDRDLVPLAEELRAAIAFAHETDEVGWSAASRPLWAGVYTALSEAREGLLGAITARAEAHVLRLALVYALLDRSREIKPEHLKAALAVWEYAEKSAALVLGDRLGHPLAEKLLARLRDALPEALDRTAVHAKLGRHVRADDLDAAFVLLAQQGLAARVREATGGRPREAWFAV